eukprot:SAG11_NODE_1514_length_4766_cov_8.064067_5_plen_42_part_01
MFKYLLYQYWDEWLLYQSSVPWLGFCVISNATSLANLQTRFS